METLAIWLNSGSALANHYGYLISRLIKRQDNIALYPSSHTKTHEATAKKWSVTTLSVCSK